MGFTKEQIDAMVNDACLVERTLAEVGSPCTSPVADVCIHVKALASEVERVQQNCDGIRLANRVFVDDWPSIHAELKRLRERVEDQDKELKARAEILDTIQKACGEGWWLGVADWRQKLRDFAQDSEQHEITHGEWKANRGLGITLYSQEDFFTAYFDDAAEMWSQADDTLPMFHVMVKSDPPHRTCIHAIHLAAWAQHCASRCMPLQIMGREE